MTKKRVAVIGAGWAGLAAAVELVDRGFHVEVFEASRTLGGRARSLEWNGLTIDNGQHILIGAYTETLRLMRKVGVDPDQALMRIPLTLWYPGEFKMVAPHLPAPFHTACALAFAQGLDWREKWAAIRLMTSLKRAHYRIEPDITVTEWLDQHQTPSRQRRLLWEPLCISALNTPAERASAQIMANVLRDSLGGQREASDLLVPRAPLSDIFPEPAAKWIEARGGQMHRGQRVPQIYHQTGRWHVPSGNTFDQIVIAVAPYHASHVLPDLAQQVSPLSYEPIVTSYLQYSSEAKLPGPMIGVADGTAQWLFDRGALCSQFGLMAAVVSARGGHLELAHEALEQMVHREITRITMKSEKPASALTITERRATFACVPELSRPNCRVRQQVHAPLLAGDYVDSEYPGTIEGAVRSGISCAGHVTALL